ncbi:type II toxin-antitoxin system VapC family toxin [Curtanaerobium respiraculi]|uniref:type II toxin-antitoxin system VapC family toxin n=1 Tax=Curtanaerobium respiraculi TaxID=2949669 RepID=UPI0024B39B33|nr:PIN domain-containing protein [Curtanaerobium respiraculi]
MNSRPLKLVFDTNVWLDIFLSSRSGHASSLAAFDVAAAQGSMVLCSFSSLKDTYCLVRSILKRQARDEGELTEADALAIDRIAWSCVDYMIQHANPIGADLSGAWIASKLRSMHGDFGDDLVIAAVQRAKADYLVTNDEKLLSHAPVAAISVSDAFSLLNSHAD